MTQDQKLILFGLIYLVILISGLYWIFSISTKFFEEANKLEKMVLDGAPLEDVMNELKRLKEKSFHRQTGNRLREIAKMAEVKYNVKIIK